MRGIGISSYYLPTRTLVVHEMKRDGGGALGSLRRTISGHWGSCALLTFQLVMVVNRKSKGTAGVEPATTDCEPVSLDRSASSPVEKGSKRPRHGRCQGICGKQKALVATFSFQASAAAGLRDPNPMVRAFGPSTEPHRCKECRHLHSHRPGENVYWKCAYRTLTHGPGTDHRKNWNACAKFESTP